MADSITQPSTSPITLRAAAQSVARRLKAGFVPWIPPGGGQSWARMRGNRLEEAGPITPPEGVVLDELAFLDADETRGALHWHRLFGRLRSHRHTAGDNLHHHVVGGPSCEKGDIIHP